MKITGARCIREACQLYRQFGIDIRDEVVDSVVEASDQRLVEIHNSIMNHFCAMSNM